MSGKKTNGFLMQAGILAVAGIIVRLIGILYRSPLVAIIGVSSIRIFALPIIFGLISGTYSSIFLAPTIWSMLASYFPGSLKAPKAKRSVLTKEK